MRDASLDDFLSSSDEESEESEEAAPASEGEVDAVETESEPEPEIGQDADSEPEAERDAESEPESDTEPESDPDSEVEGSPPVTEVEPARSTYAWSPDGATCAACGERVEEWWESEVGLVCVACKEW